MPHRSTAIPRAFSRPRISDSAARVTAGSTPRSASLAPSSTMTASVPSGTDQSSRSRPPEEVSPDTPALVISTSNPLPFNAFCNRAGNAAAAGRPRPALSESPRTTIFTGLFAGWLSSLAPPVAGPSATACPAAVKASINTSMCASAASRPSTARAQVPYDRAMDSFIEASSRAGTSPDTICISHVNLSLGTGAARVHILKDISLRVASGETIGLIGPSGSGKSTLLMVMAGLERPDSGQVVVNGTPFNALSEDALARFRGRQVGIVFQSFHLIPTMTALENVAVPLELAGNLDAAKRAAEELRSVGLGDRLHHYPSQLSGGEQQRVALARALAPRPSILVADEPTGNLDEATGKQIVDLLFAKHAERGMTLVLVTHDTSLAQRCDRVVRLRSGRIDTTTDNHVAAS